MIENDNELDLIIEQRKNTKINNELANQPLATTNSTTLQNQSVVGDIIQKQTSTFEDKMNDVKKDILINASTTDQQFVETIKENVKSTAVTYTEVEQGKANLQKQEQKYQSELLNTKQQKNQHNQVEDKWDNLRKKRQFAYDGVAPIMKFGGIDEPMNLFFLYLFAIFLTPIYIITKFVRCTFGVLLAGACDNSRSKSAKGFLWTLLCVFATIILAVIIYILFKLRNIDLIDIIFKRG